MTPSLGRVGLKEVDRSILTLAIPALGALAADPLYSLVDTAFVGNLGRLELGAVAVGTAAFTASFWLFSFLAYGVTPRVARALGAGHTKDAATIGVQATILAVALGAVVSTIGVLLAEPVVMLLGADGELIEPSASYLRIRILSSIPVLLVTVGHGWLRGAQDTRTPMIIATAGAVANIGLDYYLIYVVGWGIEGAAWATVIGQVGAAAVFAVVVVRRMDSPRLRIEAASMKQLLSIGGDLVVRAAALVGALTLATAIAARMGLVELGAWQVGMQVFGFLALVLDSVAIAAQALVGRYLGEGHTSELRRVSRRLMAWGLGFGVLLMVGIGAFSSPIAALFSKDPEVVSAAAALLVWFALIQPLSAAAFTLDGILIGATDTRFLAVWMVVASAAFIGIGILALLAGWGLIGLAAGATVWLAVRTVSLGLRFRGTAWIAA